MNTYEVTAMCSRCDCLVPFVLAAYARARPCCSGLRASLCCPVLQLVVVAVVCQLCNKDSIITIIISSSISMLVTGCTEMIK